MNKTRMGRLIALLLWCANSSLYSQSLHFQHYTLKDGLASSIVYDAFQDSRGFIWFGTESGLSRFDGTRFVNFTTANGLPANTVFKAAEDKAGRLWISCYNEGVCYFENGRFVSVKTDSMLAKLSFPNGSFTFVDSPEGFFVYDPIRMYRCMLKQPGNQLQILNSFKYDSLGGFRNLSIIDGVPWLLTSKGIYKWLNAQWILQALHQHTPTPGKYSAQGHIFFYTNAGQIRMCNIADGQVQERLLYEFDQPVEYLVATSPGVLWVQVAKEGIFKIEYEQDGNTIIRMITGISNVNFVLTDQEGTTWFTTADNGIFALLSEENVLYDATNALPANKVISLEKTPDGRLLIGDASGNLSVLQQNKMVQSRKIAIDREFNRLVSIKYDAERQETWIGTDEALFCYDRYGKCIFSQISAIKSVFLTQNEVLAGRGVALMKVDKVTKSSRDIRYGEKIMAIAADQQGRFWLGKLNGLEIMSETGNLFLQQQFPHLFQGRITGLVVAKDGVMWVATHQNGVVAIKTDLSQYTQFTTAQGLTSNICQQIRIDDEGDIWVATNNGLNKISHRNWQIQRFSVINVLPDNDVYDMLVTGDTVWAATSKGLAMFKDESTLTDPSFRTLIADVVVNNVNKYYPEGTAPELPADSCDLIVRFAALSFRSHGQFTYVFTLNRPLPPLQYLTWHDLGLRLKNWYSNKPVHTSDTLNTDLLQLSNMPHGRYVLEVTAISYDGIKSIHPDRLEFLIRPVLWQRLWFQLLCLLAGLLLLRQLYRRQIERKEQDLKLQQELTALKLEAFKAQINPHFIFNTINGIQRFFFPPDPGKANAYIVLFSGLLRKTMEFSEKTSASFASELEFLKEYLELTRMRVGDKFDYEIRGEHNIPPQTETPTMLIQPLVENAIVHGFPPSGKALLVVSFDLQKGRCICTIDDNGIGILKSLSRKQNSGDSRKSKGTALVRQRVEALNHISGKNIDLSVTDKSTLNLPESGTIATITFNQS